MMSGKALGNSGAIPLYQMVKQHMLSLIDSGHTGEDGRLPSENELVRQLSVSRMTVNRALRELAGEGYIKRISGVGTFVAERPLQSHPLEIRDIAQEIADRGHNHESLVMALEAIRAAPEIAVYFNIAAGSRLYYARILHSESGTPIQLEDRYVHPGFAPLFLEQDFSAQTTTQYLLKLDSSPSEVEQIVRASLPTTEIAAALAMEQAEPCLALSRRTWVAGKVVTKARFYHPASRYQFGSRYSP